MSSKTSSENRHPNLVILGTIGAPWDIFLERNYGAFFRVGSRGAPKVDLRSILGCFWGVWEGILRFSGCILGVL